MKELSDSIYKSLYLECSLKTAGWVLGIALILIHLVPLLRAQATKAWLMKLPRDQGVGTIFLTIAFILAMVVATSMKLGEFNRLRSVAQIAIPIMYISLLFYTNEYLGARSLGILTLLVACPLLDAAFLEQPLSRLLIPILCYAWILLALFWVGMPHTLRNQIAWLTKSDGRFKTAAMVGVAYGVAMLGCAIAFW